MRFVCWLAVLVSVAGLGCQSSAMTAAKLYIQQEQPQEAKKQLALVLQTEPENYEAHLLMGQLLGRWGPLWRNGRAPSARRAQFQVSERG